MADEILLNWEKIRISAEEEDVVPFDSSVVDDFNIDERIDKFLIGKLINKKIVNFTGLRNSLVRIWCLIGEIQVKEIGEGILAFQFSEMADR